VSFEGEDRRTEARERALALLYEADAKSIDPIELVAALAVPPDPLASTLVEGVAREQDRIDELITRYLRGWTIERMALVDRLVLSIATFELLSRPDVPTAVVIDEAVELAKRYSTEESGKFVNGMLSSIAADARPG
jgi:transcription antitermination protein NusB